MIGPYLSVKRESINAIPVSIGVGMSLSRKNGIVSIPSLATVTKICHRRMKIRTESSFMMYP
jgi:hypothetical protein